jgi:uncharacterized protein YaaN involved in tellurite resistance
VANDMAPDNNDASKVVAGAPLTPAKLENASKNLLVDENGIDIETMQEMIKKQAQLITELSTVVKARDTEDAEITRNLIISRTKKWLKPFSYDELVDFGKDDLDDLQKFVNRVGRVDLTEVDESPRVSVTKAVRKFPKLSKDNDPYDMNQHSFALGKQA